MPTINPGDLFAEWREKFNDSLTDVGDLTLLATDTNTSLVDAVNEVFADLGDVDTLTTTATNATGAVNEVHSELRRR